MVGPPTVLNRMAAPAATACHFPINSAPSPSALPGFQTQSFRSIHQIQIWTVKLVNMLEFKGTSKNTLERQFIGVKRVGVADSPTRENKKQTSQDGLLLKKTLPLSCNPLLFLPHCLLLFFLCRCIPHDKCGTQSSMQRCDGLQIASKHKF